MTGECYYQYSPVGATGLYQDYDKIFIQAYNSSNPALRVTARVRIEDTGTFGLVAGSVEPGDGDSVTIQVIQTRS